MLVHLHLKREPRSLIDDTLLIRAALYITLTALLVEKFAGFRHGHSHHLGLASLTTLTTSTAAEHLQSLHSSRTTKRR